MPANPKDTTLERLSGAKNAVPTESTVNTVANTAGHTSSWSLVVQFGMISYLTGRVRPLRRLEPSRMVVPDASMSLRALP
jgi:hypothetical protein